MKSSCEYPFFSQTLNSSLLSHYHQHIVNSPGYLCFNQVFLPRTFSGLTAFACLCFWKPQNRVCRERRGIWIPNWPKSEFN